MPLLYSVSAFHKMRTQPLFDTTDHPPKPQLSSQFHIVHKIQIQLSEGETNDSPKLTLDETAATLATASGTPGKGEKEGPEGVPGTEETKGASGQVEEVGEASGGSSQTEEPAKQGDSKGTCGGPPDDSETITEQNNFEDEAPQQM